MAVDPLTAGLELASTVVNKIWPDKSEQERAELAGALAIIQGQLDINKEEAKNPNLFVSGWRPFVGWMCGSGLGYNVLIYPVAIAWFPKLQQADMGTLMTLLLALLGMGGMRMYEKLNGVAAK